MGQPVTLAGTQPDARLWAKARCGPSPSKMSPLTFTRGEIVLLMGPFGERKSTLLFDPVRSAPPGERRRGGPRTGPVASVGAEREQFRLRNFGFIFQGYNLFPALTARQQLEIVLRWGNNLPGREARALCAPGDC